MAARLAQAPQVAVDTESNSLFAYHEQVCLIQFSIPGKDYLVDPLALTDLSSLAPVFSDPRIEKIFHAAEYDIICLKRDFGFQFSNLFDTMLAARILSRPEIGLGAVLEAEFGITLDKRYQRANWGQRPLPSELLAYGQMDTHFLIELRERLYGALVEQGRWELAQEDFKRLASVEGNGRTLPDDPQAACLRMSGINDLTPQQLAILVELCRYRDRIARQLNRPLFKVIGDRTLIELAAVFPASLGDLRRVYGLSPRMIDRHGQALLQAVARGMKAPPVHLPRHPRPDDAYLNRLDVLRQWRKSTGEKMGMPSDVILPRDLLTALAERNPKSSAELEDVLKESPWRLANWGPAILKILARR
jgi:ribonuclease D